MTWARHRLRTPEQFRTATRRGARSARSHVVAHLVLRDSGGVEPRVGFVVSKKVGNSVVRNRVARRLREIFRAQLPTLPPGADVVLRALPGIEAVPFAELEREVAGAMASAARKALADRERSGRARADQAAPMSGTESPA